MASNLEERTHPIALLHIGAGDHNGQQESSHINQDMALATLEPFGAIETCRATLIGHLHGLRSAPGGTGLAVAAFKDPHSTSSHSVDRSLGVFETPLTKIGINEAIRRTRVREHAPGATLSDDVEETVEHLTVGRRCGASTGLG